MPRFSWKYALILTSIIILAVMVMDFNNRMSAMRALSVERERVAAQVTQLASEKAALETQIAHAQSDAAVAEWAYEQGHMIRPGDNPIVPMQPFESTPVPTPTPSVTRRQVENWQMWLWLFMDPPNETAAR